MHFCTNKKINIGYIPRNDIACLRVHEFFAFFFFNVYFTFERDSMSWGGAEREGERESHAGSMVEPCLKECGENLKTGEGNLALCAYVTFLITL